MPAVKSLGGYGPFIHTVRSVGLSFMQVSCLVSVVYAQTLPASFDSLLPTHQGEIVRHTYYTLSYSEQHEQPEWVAYELTPLMLAAVYSRKDSFRQDPAVSTLSATYKDYTSFKGYDAGHMLACRAMQFDCLAMAETFFMSNMSPQVSELNRKKWAQLERLERNMAMDNGGVFAVTGPVLIGVEQCIGVTTLISVPKYYYKVILDQKQTKAIAFVIPNRDESRPLAEYAVTVDSVENLTGIDFFHAMEDIKEQRLESCTEIERWDFSNPVRNFGYSEEAKKCPSLPPTTYPKKLIPKEKLIEE